MEIVLNVILWIGLTVILVLSVKSIIEKIKEKKKRDTEDAKIIEESKEKEDKN